MSKERILETIGQVKDEFIEEAAPKGLLNKESKKDGIKNIYPYLKWGALAACLCIIVGLSVKMDLFSASKEDAAFDTSIQMNQSAETESVMEETKADYERGMNGAVSDSVTGAYTTGADYNTSAEDVMTDEGFPDWGLYLSVKNVTPSGLTLVVTQTGGNPTGELQTGEPYRLISLVDGTWKVVEELPLPEGVDGRGWNSMAYLIQKGETKEFDINWEWIFGELPTGTYRLIKEFMDFKETGNYDTFEYWVEFVIQ